MPKVSVIIPVYNTEKYLRKCLESVISQTLKDIEVICINDCSTDDCLNILNDIKDSRLRIINLEQNSGVSFARNKGIQDAKGEYISFVDSDDFIAPDFLEKLYNKSNGSDAVKGNIYDFDEKTGNIKLTDFYNMNDKIRENYSYFYYGFTGAIYKREFIEKFNICFPEGINYFEDPFFSIKACLNYNKIEFDDSAKYYYRIRQDSLSRNLTKEKICDLIKVLKDVLNLINTSDLSKENYKIIFDFLFKYAYYNYNSPNLKNEYNELLFDTVAVLILNSKFQPQIPFAIYKKFKGMVSEGLYYDLILDAYKNYDYLNENSSFVKILVSYIKPSFLFKTDILTPIHLGREVEKDISKDGKISDNEISWLHQNCIGDNDFDGNISSVNRRLGFFTGTYWAWKNYNKLGNPEYFGSFGYRRLLFPNCLTELNQYDLILPIQKALNESIKSHYISCHGQKGFDAMMDSIKAVYPEELNAIENYFDRSSGYFAELYIMKKKLFFPFCEWLDKILKYMLKNYPELIDNTDKTFLLINKFTQDVVKEDSINKQDNRDIAFIFERLTGYYLFKLRNTKNIKSKEVAVFEKSDVISVEYKMLVLSAMREKVKKSFMR